MKLLIANLALWACYSYGQTDLQITDSTDQINAVIIEAELFKTIVDCKELPINEEDAIIDWVEISPEFPGGIDSLYAYLKRELHYPIKALEIGVQLMVYVKFVVEKNGSITNIKIIKGEDPLFNDVVTEVIQEMPLWKPGVFAGEVVRSSYIIPIKFKLS